MAPLFSWSCLCFSHIIIHRAHFIQVRLLSPVPTELDSSEILEGSIADDVSFQTSVTTGPIASLRDAVDNRVTLVRLLRTFLLHSRLSLGFQYVRET